MKKNLLFVSLVLFLNSYSQVGINTSNPKATLDVVGSPTEANVIDGIIVPKLTGNQLTAKNYTMDHKGTIVYVTSSASSLIGQVANVDSEGFYYFDGSSWLKFVTSITNTLSSSNNILTSNTNGISSSTPIVNSVKNVISNNNLITTINGISSAAITLPSSNTTNALYSSDNILLSNVNGIIGTAPIVNSVKNVISNNKLTTTINGISSTAITLPSGNITNTLYSSDNILLSNVNGITSTAPIVNSIKNIISNNNLTTTINGISSAAISLPLTNLYNSNGSLTSSRNVNLNGYNLGFTGTGNIGIGTDSPASKLHVVGNVRISTMEENNLNTDKVVTVNTSGDLKKVNSSIFYNSIDQTINFVGSAGGPYTATGNEDVIWLAGIENKSILKLLSPTDAQVKRGRTITIIAAGADITFSSDSYKPVVVNGKSISSLSFGHRISIVPVNIFGGKAWYVISSSQAFSY